MFQLRQRVINFVVYDRVALENYHDKLIHDKKYLLNLEERRRQRCYEPMAPKKENVWIFFLLIF